jgi:hypothetical protein
VRLEGLGQLKKKDPVSSSGIEFLFFMDEILNRRNLMNISKIRLQCNLEDYNIKIMKHQGTWEVRK